MKLIIYITPKNGDGVPIVWKQLDIEIGEINLPMNLFAPDVVVTLNFSDNT